MGIVRLEVGALGAVYKRQKAKKETHSQRTVHQRIP
jgi:hypothetical protein